MLMIKEVVLLLKDLIRFCRGKWEMLPKRDTKDFCTTTVVLLAMRHRHCLCDATRRNLFLQIPSHVTQSANPYVNNSVFSRIRWSVFRAMRKHSRMLYSFLTPLSSWNILNHNDNNFQLSQILKVKCYPPNIFCY